jgi:hypothetical protein
MPGATPHGSLTVKGKTIYSIRSKENVGSQLVYYETDGCDVFWNLPLAIATASR